MAAGDFPWLDMQLKKLGNTFDWIIRSKKADLLDYTLVQTLDLVVGAYRLARSKGMVLPRMDKKGYH